MATLRPRMDDGEISAMYMGDSIEAIPTPIPAINRMSEKMDNPGARAMPREDRAKMPAAIINPGRRPRRSANEPATKHPTIQPNAKVPVRKPSHQAFKLNSARKKGNAPAITAKSNPNK